MTRLLDRLVPADALCVRAFICLGDLRAVTRDVDGKPVSTAEWDEPPHRRWIR